MNGLDVVRIVHGADQLVIGGLRGNPLHAVKVQQPHLLHQIHGQPHPQR